MTQQHSTTVIPSWRVAPPALVKARIANAALTPIPEITLGDITLFPHQADAVSRLRLALSEYHGALLADDVGLGKTYIALALAAEYRVAHVIAPAALLPMWREALARTGIAHVVVHSLHAYSHNEPQQVHTERGLVIVDEAHHLRTRTTRRHHAVARFVAGHDVLLMSATPLYNTSRELRQLLALFAGNRSDLLDANVLAQVVVRRTAVGASASRPNVHEHKAYDVPHDRATLNAILALPAPLAAHNGTVSGALIRLGLLRAWCSSDAALSHAIRRRLLRGEALRQALLAGRHPTQAELRSWLVGDHEVQLAFPELVADQRSESGAVLDVLERHLDSLLALQTQHHASARGDAVRAAHLRQIVAAHPGVPVVAFSQFTQTVHALYRALADIAGVGSLSGSHARIASGFVSREDVIARFAPIASSRPPPPPHQAVRLLLTTDLLAEGVNLHDAGIVVHCDLPWTDALRTQRVGRCARIGSRHAVVEVFQLGPPTGSAHVLRLRERLAHKARLADHFVGAQSTTRAIASGRARTRVRSSAADMATRVQAELRSWASAVSPPLYASPTPTMSCVSIITTGRPTEGRRASIDRATEGNDAVASVAVSDHLIAKVARNNAGWRDGLVVAGLRARQRGFLALLVPPTAAGARRSLGAAPSTGRVLAYLEPWRVPRDGSAAIWRVLSQLEADAAAFAHTHGPHQNAVLRALKLVARWQQGQRIASMLGTAPLSLSSVQLRAEEELGALVRDLPPLQRAALGRDIDRAHDAIRAAHTMLAQDVLAQWVASRSASDAAHWLRLCPHASPFADRVRITEVAQSAPDLGNAASDVRGSLCVSALLLLMVPDPP